MIIFNFIHKCNVTSNIEIILYMFVNIRQNVLIGMSRNAQNVLTGRSLKFCQYFYVMSTVVKIFYPASKFIFNICAYHLHRSKCFDRTEMVKTF